VNTYSKLSIGVQSSLITPHSGDTWV